MGKDVVDRYIHPIVNKVLRRARGKVNKTNIILKLEHTPKDAWKYRVFVNDRTGDSSDTDNQKYANKHFNDLIEKYNLKEDKMMG